MKKYLILYQSEAALTGMTVSEMFARTTPAQMKAGMGAISALLDKSTVVAGGSGTPSKTSITGHTIPQAASMDEAVSLIKDHPHFHGPGASVQILECVAMPGM